MTRNRPERDLSDVGKKWDNYTMNELIETLRRIGVPESELRRIMEMYRDDLDGLKHYVLYMRALLDDRHEYV